MESRREEIERLWRDPGSLRGGRWLNVYYQPKDPRVVVPRRIVAFGWTVNFAHRRAFAVIVLAALLVTVPVLAALAMGVRSVAAVVAIEAASIALLCVASAYLATRFD